MANTPPQLLQHGVDKHSRSKKLSRVVDSYIGPERKKYKAIVTIMQHLGAMAQHGDPAAIVNRVLQDEMAAWAGLVAIHVHQKLDDVPLAWRLPQMRWRESEDAGRLQHRV